MPPILIRYRLGRPCPPPRRCRVRRHLACLLLLGVAPCVLAASVPGFAVTRALQPVVEREELAAVTLDRDVYRVTRDGFPDLRVVDAGGRLVPFTVDLHRQTRVDWAETTVPGTVRSLAPETENRIDVLVAAPRLPESAEGPAWVELVSPLRDFEKRVTVAVQFQGEWRVLAEGAPVYDYSRFMDVRSCRVPLPANAPADALYRLAIGDVTDESESALVELTRQTGGGSPDQETVKRYLRRRDFRIDAIRFGFRVRRELADAPVLESFPLHVLERREDAKARATELMLDAARLPVSALAFAVDGHNFSRSVDVDARLPDDAGGTVWRRVGGGTLQSFRFRGLAESRLEIRLETLRTDVLRVTIANGDLEPLPVTAVIASCPVHRVHFLAEPGVAYSLAYGSPAATPPQHDPAVVRRVMSLQRRAVVPLTLSPLEAPSALPRPALWLRLLNSGYALTAAILLALAVLGWGMVRTLRRVNSLSE